VRNFLDIKTEMKNLRKETIYNYKYLYYDGDETSMTLNTEMCEKYGNDRPGYERFKNEPSVVNGSTTQPGEVDIAYGGYVSVRALTHRGTKKVFGYITEEKLSYSPHRDKARELYDEALKSIKNVLGVRDEKSFQFYLDDKISFDYMSSRDGVDDYDNAFDRLQEIVLEYNDDEEFKAFLDKIIK